MRLVEPAARWRSPFLEMAHEFEAVGEHRYGPALRDFDDYLRNLEANRHDSDLPGGRVPSIEYWLEREDQVIGCARIRFRLTPALEHEGGHIGYEVRPCMRRQGYGTTLLRLALAEARSLGIERVRVTCDDANAGSIKVIERNGGTLDGRAMSRETGQPIRQYWIENTLERRP